MHDWSDDSFDWKSLDESINMMGSFMHFWGRIGVHAKEKYGTVRLTPFFWDGSLHSLCYPRYVVSQFPKWLWAWDLFYISKFFRWTRLPKLVQWYQSKIYGLAYAKAIKAFPHIKFEIVACADAPELIRGYDDIVEKYRFMLLLRKIVLPVEYEEE